LDLGQVTPHHLDADRVVRHDPSAPLRGVDLDLRRGQLLRRCRRGARGRALLVSRRLTCTADETDAEDDGETGAPDPGPDDLHEEMHPLGTWLMRHAVPRP